MAIAEQRAVELVPDGDVAFLRVNSRKPAHALLPGEVAAAENMRFDEGKPQSRLGIQLQTWGNPLTELIPDGTLYSDAYSTNHTPYIVSGLTVGLRYFYVRGNSTSLSSVSESVEDPNDPGTIIDYVPVTEVDPGSFIATQTQYTLLTTEGGQLITAQIFESQPTCAYARFSDPNGFDNGILVTDDWRDGNGEDGGRGRAWRIYPGQPPQAISLNGHDVWGPARLVQAFHTMILARHGFERHYFSAAAVDAANDWITLNVVPGWSNGDLVYYFPEENSQILTGPNPNAGYYVRTDTATKRVTLHPTKADAIAGTNNIGLGAATGKFYLERREPDPGPGGKGAPVLIMQGNTTQSAFEVGFAAAPTAVQVTSSVASLDTVTALNHHLLTGDQVTATLSTDGALSKYARVLSEHVITLYDTQDHALAGGATGLFNISADAQTGTVVKTGAAQLAIPPLRELIYYKGRIIGVISGTTDQVVISDPFDFLHFSMFTGPVSANLGESGEIRWFQPAGDNALLIGKELAVLVLSGLMSPNPLDWQLDDVTRQYGGSAALAALNVGEDVWFLSRQGMVSISRTVAGEQLGVARAISTDVPADFLDLDWANIAIACAATWNNRLFLSVPVKGQDADDVRNNRTIPFNFLNQSLTVRQEAVAGQIIGGVMETDGRADSWEGRWSGELLEPVAYARLKIFGEERLTFATPDGLVCWFTDGFEDAGPSAIASSVTTRGYFGGAEVLALKGELRLETFNPSLTVKAQTAGYNEQITMLEDVTRDPTKYLVDGIADYDPSTSTQEQFDAPHREDYSTTPEELLVGRLDVHQSWTQPLRMRLRDRSPQIVVENAQGNARLTGAMLKAKPVGSAGGKRT